MASHQFPIALAVLVAISLLAPAATSQEQAATQPWTTFELRSNPLLELHMFVRSQLAAADAQQGQSDPDAQDEKAAFASAIAAARKFEETMPDARLWGLIEPAIASADSAGNLSAAFSRLPEVSRRRDGQEVRLRDAAVAYADALSAVEPAFRERLWPERARHIERGRQRIGQVFAGREQLCINHLVMSLKMNVPRVRIPVYLVTAAPPPGGFTHRGRNGPICIVSVAEEDDSILAETVVHELIHGLEEAEPSNPLSRLRAVLHEQGIDPFSPDGRDIVHTVVFVQAGETVRTLLDPDHVHYGEARGYYSKVPAAVAAVRDTWERYLAGEVEYEKALLGIADAAAKRSVQEQPQTRPANVPPEQVFIFPYFQSNGETGIFLALSHDGLSFEATNGGRSILPAPRWRGNSLTRDPSILFHNGTFHMVWTTDWGSRSIGYSQSDDLVAWSEPRRIDLWGDDAGGAINTWAPELHWDPQAQEFFILFSSTLKSELEDGDGSEEPANLDHRIYAVRTRDFQQFTPPELFYSPMEPEHSVIDAFVVPDDRGTADAADDRWVMVVKNELAPERGGKNLRLAFAERAQGPYETTLSEPIAGQGSAIIDQMAEGPSLLKVDGEWRLYFDAPGSREPYSLATSPDLVTWTNRSEQLRMPVEHPRHGTVARVPAEAVGWLKQPRTDR